MKRRNAPAEDLAPAEEDVRRGFGERLFQAANAFELQLKRRVSQAEIGRLTADRLGAKTPIPQPTVARWLEGTIPDARTVIAIALALDTSPGWLLFGERPTILQTREKPDPIEIPNLLTRDEQERQVRGKKADRRRRHG